MKKWTLLTLLFGLCVHAASFEGNIEEWRQHPKEQFKDPKKNFDILIEKIKKDFMDRGLTDEELYRAASAGVLASLNSKQDEWNVLMSPAMLEDFWIMKTRKLTGIGATLKMEEELGVLRVDAVLPKSAAQKAGLVVGDVILSVDGQSCKGRTLPDLVQIIRGPSGGSVKLKVLREDKILNFNITRAEVVIPGIESVKVDAQTSLLTIDAFSKGTSEDLAARLNEIQDKKIRRLVLDLRTNNGGDFDEAVKSAELFLNAGSTIVRAHYANNEAKEFKAAKTAWRPEVKLVVLIDKVTSSGAELLAGVLHEARGAFLIGNTTHGKWNGQTLEELPNKFAIKYQTMKFETAEGHSYQGTGLLPDLELAPPKDNDIYVFQREKDLKKRLGMDTGLRAALQIPVGT